jgi:twitching motility protein PilT
LRLRGNAFVQQGKYAMALRLIPNVKTLAELNLPPALAEFARRRQGFFLVVGPVGQGKSSTMASMISLINEERAAHVLTIEDPIEYVYEEKKSLINQREIGIDAPDFESALRSAFREDVNVILIGEMRNPETISTAVTAAETGHLVLSTLHTNNASQTIDRIIDSFPPQQQDQIRIQLAASLIGVFSQRLVPRIAGGRVPAYELLINNAAVSNLIRERRTHEIDMVIETGFEQGMVDMNRSLIELIRAGEITPETAFSYSLNPKNLERLM